MDEELKDKITHSKEASETSGAFLFVVMKLTRTILHLTALLEG